MKPSVVSRAARLALAVLAGATLSATAAAPKKPAAKPQPAGPVEIELVHHLGGAAGEQMREMVERFNAAQGGVKVVLSERPWDEGGLPALLLLGEDEADRFLAGKSRYRPLHQVMKEAGESLVTFKQPPQQMTPTPLDGAGRLAALPIALSTPVMFYNREAFAKAGLDPEAPPKTWWDLQQALGKLYDAGYTCPYTSSWPVWVHVGNVSAWHNEAVAVSAGKREGPLAVNGMLQVKHLAMMSSWYKSRYLHIFGRRDEGDAKFAAGECAVLTSASAAFADLARAAKFEVGVATLPYHDDIRGAPQNTLADGAALWVGAGLPKAQYKAAAKFVAYLLTPESQVEWQRRAGYLPLNRAGFFAASSDLLGGDLANVRVALKQLTFKPVTPASASSRFFERAEVRAILDEELEAIWANRKPPKEALDTAVARSRSLGMTVACGPNVVRC